jgi:hypothetical protein
LQGGRWGGVFVEFPCKAIVSIVFLILALLERNVICFISIPSSYRVVNTVQLGYKHQSFSASYGKSCFLETLTKDVNAICGQNIDLECQTLWYIK